MDYTKTITPAYETIGKRRKLTGYIGEIRDGDIVLHSAHYDNHHDAETSLNAVVYDLLTDLAERGLVDTLPQAKPTMYLEHSGLPNPLYRIQMHERVEAPSLPACATCGDDGDCPDCDLPLFDDVARVLDMALGQSHGAASVVAELRRVRARLAAVAAEQEQSAEAIAAHMSTVYLPNWQPTVIADADLPY